MKIRFILLPFLLATACSGEVNTVTPSETDFVLEPRILDLDRVAYPGKIDAKFTFKNNTNNPIDIIRVSGSCSCQSFQVAGTDIVNGALIKHTVLANSEATITFKTNVKPIDQDLGVSISLSNDWGVQSKLTYFGLAPVQVIPPRHDFGNVKKGTAHKWMTRIKSTTDDPIQLTKSDNSITLTKEGDGKVWRLEGEILAEQEGMLSNKHLISTNINDVPYLTIIATVNVPRRVDLMPVANVSVENSKPLDYVIQSVFRDEALKIKAVSLEPKIDGVIVSHDGRSIKLNGNPIMGSLARSNIKVVFNDKDYPDGNIRLFLLKR